MAVNTLVFWSVSDRYSNNSNYLHCKVTFGLDLNEDYHRLTLSDRHFVED